MTSISSPHIPTTGLADVKVTGAAQTSTLTGVLFDVDFGKISQRVTVTSGEGQRVKRRRRKAGH